MRDHSKEFIDIYLDRVFRALKEGKAPIDRIATHGEAILSFDGKYRAFIPTTTGYNHPDDRIYLRKCKFTDELGLELHRERLQNSETVGGRVFVNNSGSFLKNKDGQLFKFSNRTILLK